MSYAKEFLVKIFDADKWPGIGDNENVLDNLTSTAHDFFSKGTFEGYTAALLIYHQLCEEMIKALISESRFFIQCKLFPTEMEFNKKKRKSKMFGDYLEELKKTINFEEKEEFIKKCNELNAIRIEVVHEIIQKKSIDEIQDKLVLVKEIHDRLFELFGNAHTCFMSYFKDLRKDDVWEEHLKEYQEILSELKADSTSSQENIDEYEQIVAIIKKNTTIPPWIEEMIRKQE